MKRIFFSTLTIIVCLLCNLQAKAMDAEADKGGVVKGTITDSRTGQPIEYATVAVYTTANQLVTGSVSNIAGEFKIANIPNGNFYVLVTFLGYQNQRFDNIEISEARRLANLGQIKLASSAESLNEVEVVGQRKSFEYRIDKKVVNVGNQATTASMTAIEVLENVPSVKVDIEGNVSLRGSGGFTVLIDGKPTILEGSDALRQIPASSIDNIEIITNPSAKYQPDGTAGIINVITKKNKNQGINGQVSANAGMYGTYGGDALLNLRRKKINYTLGLDYNKRVFPGESTYLRETYLTNPIDTVTLVATGDGERNMRMYGLRAGMEIDVNKSNSATLGVRYGSRNMNNETTALYSQSSSFDPMNVQRYTSLELGERGGDFYSVNGSWTHQFETKGHELRAQFDFSSRTGTEESENKLLDTNGTPTEARRNIENGPADRGEVRIDYTLPFSETSKLEAGFQGRAEAEEDETGLANLNTVTGVYEADPLYAKDSKGTQNIQALYTTYSGTWLRLGYQAGLRGEYTYRNIAYGSKDFNIDRFDYFPTVHLSYTLPAENQLMASYARRVERTRGWYLEPFVTWQDAYNVRTGNADILPEFIDSYELGYLKQFEKAYFSMEAYYRTTHNKVEMIATIWDDATENPDGKILMRKPYNIGRDHSVGLEGTFNLKQWSWWDATLMGSLYNYEIEGEANGKDFSNSTFNWSGRLNNTFYLKKTLQLQFNGNFNSPTATAQGRNEAYYSFDAALRADWLNRKLSTVVQLRDVFATGTRENWARSTDFYSHDEWGMKAPLLSFTVTYRFNNYNPKGKNGRTQTGGSEEMGGDDF